MRPPTGYRPRVADPRLGLITLTFRDYSAPFNQGADVQWVRRFRLEKKDWSAALSEPKVPIVIYLDAGVPEPIRSAMRDGILWWNQAFEAAGFRNALQVKDPTPDIDPLDPRVSFVFWVNRDERGFSVGGSLSDPRTGEILSARARMDIGGLYDNLAVKGESSLPTEIVSAALQREVLAQLMTPFSRRTWRFPSDCS